MSLELNPFLTSAGSGRKGGGLFTEAPHEVDNIVFQTRGAPLTDFEDRLAESLMAAFSQGASELSEVVQAMNAGGGVDDQGQAWTEDRLEAVLESLGTQVFAYREEQA